MQGHATLGRALFVIIVLPVLLFSKLPHFFKSFMKPKDFACPLSVQSPFRAHLVDSNPCNNTSPLVHSSTIPGQAMTFVQLLL